MIQPLVIGGTSGHGAPIAAAESVKLRTSTRVVRWIGRIDAFAEESSAWAVGGGDVRSRDTPFGSIRDDLRTDLDLSSARLR